MKPGFRRVSTARGLPLATAGGARRTPRSGPLATLPNSVLFRSLLINGITSRPWLLSPSIMFMNLMCKPNPSVLFDVERNKLLAWIMKSTIYKQFCAGENVAECKHKMKTMKQIGFRGTILTYGKETVYDHRTKMAHGLGVDAKADEGANQCPSIQAWLDGTLETVSMLGEGDQLAIKVTGAGPLVTDALASNSPPPQQMTSALRTIARRCKEQGATILVDAESQRYQQGIFAMGLDLMREFNNNNSPSLSSSSSSPPAAPAVIYNTYQAYLKSTPTTISAHLEAAASENFTLGLKVVRGAYLASEPRQLIHDTKEDTDDAYNAIAQGALRRELCGFGGGGNEKKSFPGVNLILASHNKESLVGAYKLYRQRVREGLPTVPVKFAQLQGMADEVSFSLLGMKDGGGGTEGGGGGAGGKGPEVYKCSTWGSLGECLAYLARRAMENRDAAGRTAGEYAALRNEVGRRVRSFLMGGGGWGGGGTGRGQENGY